VRTGVTSVLPRGKRSPTDAVFAGWFSQNGNGEMTGTTWVEDSGLLYGPVMITNTHSVRVVRDAVIGGAVKHHDFDKSDWWSLPVVAETWDGWLNDINGLDVKPEHAFAALDDARGGPVTEGNVGGGTGMICYEFKGGIGTASRVVKDDGRACTVGGAGAGQLRTPQRIARGRCAGRPGDSRGARVRGTRVEARGPRPRLDHRRRRDRRTAAAAPAGAHRAKGHHGDCPHRRGGGQWVGRHLH